MSPNPLTNKTRSMLHELFLAEHSKNRERERERERERYTALVEVVNRLMKERKLKFQPEFLFPIVSSLGYVNDDMNKLLKFMENCFKRNLSQERRFDGLGC